MFTLENKKFLIPILFLAVAITGAAFVMDNPEPDQPLGADKSIKDQLEGKTEDEKAEIKSEEISKLDFLRKQEKNNIEMEIFSLEKIPDGGVSVLVRAWKHKEQLGFGDDGSVEVERFQIYNPPILVADGTKTQKTNEFGQTYEVDNYKEDPEAALLEVLAQVIDMTAKEDAVITPGKVGHTTSVFHSTAGSGSGTVDGRTFVNADAVWATARARVTGDFGSATEDSAFVAMSGHDGGSVFIIVRSFFLFDTSALTGNVTSATFGFRGQAVTDFDNDANSFVNVVQTTPADDNNIVTADFDQSGLTEGSTRLDLTVASTTGFNKFDLNATGLTWIDTGGVTKLGLREGHDFSDADPPTSAGGSRFMNITGKYADIIGTSDDPKLVVNTDDCDPATTQCTDTFVIPGFNSWTAPANVTSAKAACWGSGGGGDVIASSAGGGGGGGEFASSSIVVVPGTKYDIFIAVGGAGGTTPAPGATSTFATTTVKAGGGGPANNMIGGAGGGGGTGDVKSRGGNGGGGHTTTDTGGGGGGAGGPSGVGGNGAAGDGTVGGGGGGGNAGGNASGSTGGAAGPNGGAGGTGDSNGSSDPDGGEGADGKHGGGGAGGGDDGDPGGSAGMPGGGGGGAEILGTDDSGLAETGFGAGGRCEVTYQADAVAVTPPTGAPVDDVWFFNFEYIPMKHEEFYKPKLRA